MADQNFQNINLNNILENPNNPRKNFKGTDFDNLVESVRQKGVLEPILVRPVNGGGTFQIVAGERRFRASQKAGKETIPAMVREMSDEEAFDAMTIENLHREDLNEVEEAECFKHYLDTKGPDAAGDLAQRTGIDERYIRRRVRLLTLPKQVIDAWRDGKILYGHCEQLMRLSRKEQIMEFFNEIIEDTRCGEPPSVKNVKHTIDDMSPKMATAKFDTKQCAQCTMNSSIQAGLFGDDFGTEKKKDCCLNPACFKKKQAEWLKENWSKTTFHKKYKTNGFLFQEDVDKDDSDDGEEKYNTIHDYQMQGKKDLPCFECKDFVSIIRIDLSEGYYGQGRTCAGDKECYKKHFATARSSGSSGGEKKTTSKDHGPEFQDRFYREAIRKIINDEFKDHFLDNEHILRLLAFTLINRDGLAKSIFVEEMKLKDRWGDSTEIWRALEKIECPELDEWIVKTSLSLTLDNHQIAQYHEYDNLKAKHLIAKHIGIDLARDWQITKEYLQCKTITEIVRIGKDLKIFDDPAVRAFAQSTLKMKSENWAGMKKKDLIRLFLESGLDLAGKVPKEILKVK